MKAIARYTRIALLAAGVTMLAACGDALVDPAPFTDSNETTLTDTQTHAPDQGKPADAETLQAPESSDASPVVYKIMSRY